MPRSKDYREDLFELLKDSEEAVEYLNAALEDDDPEVFLLTLRDVAEARVKGMTQLAKKTHLNRENLYKILSKKGTTELTSLGALLKALGLRLSVEARKAS